MQSETRLPGTEVTLFEDKAAVAKATADAVLEAARAAIARHRRFRLCLAGGTTPAAAYELLRDADADWGRWWIYHGDERCVPQDDAQRNSLAADLAWLAQVPIPREQVFSIPAELGAEEGALQYQRVVKTALPFDLVLLGIGEDGHTASLFPGRTVPAEVLVMPVHESPKPPPDRVSLTPAALSDCGKMLILVTGGGKAHAIERWRRGEELPVAQVAAGAPSMVYIDRAAAGADPA